MQDECTNTIFLVLEDLEKDVARKDEYIDKLEKLNDIIKYNVFTVREEQYNALVKRVKELETKAEKYTQLYSLLSDDEKAAYELLKEMKRTEGNNGR